MVIRIPEAGLQVESSAKTMAGLPAQAFAITLSDSVIEDLIECVQNGKDIKLSMGNIPSLVYGSSTHNFSRAADALSYDLFLSDPSEPARKVNRLPNPTMSLFRKPELNKILPSNLKEGKRTPLHKTAPTAAGKESHRDDADIEALKNSFAQAEAEKWENSTRVIEGPAPNTKRGNLKPGKKLPSAMSTYTVTNSLPASPALSGIGSPSLNPSLSASQQAAAKAKKARSPIIHELAFKEQTHDNLWQKYPGDSQDEFKTALEKVADLDKDTQNYVLKKMYWKELDVWNHEYASDEERQQAIDNAVKQYDRMRLTASEPEWQKLLPKEERGKGKCLSKVQANIMKGPPPAPAPAPKIKVQKAEDSNGESGSSKDDGAEKKKPAKGGDSSVRSSQSAPKTKKVVSKDVPEKRWLSNKKAATPKVSPTKPSPKPSSEKVGKFKSKEFISDSDSSDDESAPLANSVSQSKVARKTVEKVVKESPAPQPKPKPKRPIEETIKPQITAKPPVKRSREDDDSSSSSGTPLSKRFKVKDREIKAAPIQTLKHRASDASQNSRGTSSGVSFTKSKNTSPIKSSPLASSPPTNASDMEPSEDSVRVGKKRKADRSSDSSVSKRQHLSQDLLNKAVKFRVYYEKYEALHKEMVALDDPPVDKVADLREMRGRLERMKTEIYDEAAPAR